MIITSIDIPINPAVGLDHIKMDKLGQVVILAGKNGSGKSRILNQIAFNLKQKPGSDKISQAIKDLQIFQKARIVTENQIDNISHKDSTLAKELEQLKTNREAHFKNEEARKNIINWNFITTSDVAENYSAITFVPKSTSLQHVDNVPKSEITTRSKAIDIPGVDSINSGTLAKIEEIKETYLTTTHPELKFPEEKILEARENFSRLKQIIETFLSTTLKIDEKGNCLLFDKQLNNLRLSDGQVILIQFCLAIYSQKVKLHDLILILDEPENHLHPKALKEVIETIVSCIPNGQVWIATHSITLLSQFDPNAIWYVNEGKIKHAGRQSEIVLNSLLGDSDDINKLQDFLDLPAQFAVSRYALECLLPPDVLLTEHTDPQISQINEAIKSIRKGKKLKLLDYGAGKGRLLSNLYDLMNSETETITGIIDYVAFDIFDSDKGVCEKNIAKVYTDYNRYYNSVNDLLAHHDKKSFDVIVMCNVLHEIPPSVWIKIFKEKGLVDNILKDDGYLLLVEDNQIPKGEKAYNKGFLVLDTSHIKDLFNIPATEPNFLVDEQRSGRLKSHLVPKKYLKNINSENLKSTLESIKSTSIEKIIALRTSGSTSYSDGKLHAFYSQQLTNAVLNLEDYE